MDLKISLDQDKIRFLKWKDAAGLNVIKTIINSIHYNEIESKQTLSNKQILDIIEKEYIDMAILVNQMNSITHRLLYNEINHQMDILEKYIGVNRGNSLKRDLKQEIPQVVEFITLLEEIREINKSEPKSLEVKLIKFNEEFGEFSAELIKAFGESYKPYSKVELTKEMADVLQVILSIYDTIDKKYGITIDDVFKAMKIKNEKWKNTIEKYQNNL